MNKNTNQQINKPTNVIRIYVEGNTEQQYLKCLLDLNSINTNKITEDNINNIEGGFFDKFFSTFELLTNNNTATNNQKTATINKGGNSLFLKKLLQNKDLLENALFVFDTENSLLKDKNINWKSTRGVIKTQNKTTNQQKKDILMLLRNNMFFTNDKFEFWLALHFDKSAKINNYDEIIKSFNVLHGKQIHPKNTLYYDKNNLFNTCKESKARYDDILDRKHKNDKISILTETDEAFSEMHLLIDELNKP